MSAVRCACGRAHRDPSDLPLVGYQPMLGGELAELRNCPCGSTICVRVHQDAALCRACHELVTGRAADGDPKIVVQHCDGGVYCRRCAPTLQYAGEEIETARAMRRVLAAGGHLRRPMLCDEDAIEARAS